MRSTRLLPSHWSAAAACLALAMAARSFGGAFEVLQQSARASGQAEAFAAQADDASAIWYNPAGLTQLEGTNVSAGGYIVLPDEHFKGVEGDASNHQVSLLPHFYGESDFGLENIRFGLGVNNVFGLRETWGTTGPLETQFQRGHLYVINIEPTVAYKFSDNFSAGVGFNVYYGSADLERKQPLGPPPIPLGSFRFHGTDASIGASPAVMWKIDAQNTIGAFYHSPFTLNLTGPADVTGHGIPTIGPSRVTAGIHIPQGAGIGYAIHPIPALKLEADIVWSNWAALQQISFKSASPAFNGSKIPTAYHDTWSFRFGTQYDLTQNWSIRGGYAYGTSAAPQATFSPIVPDSNYHLFSAGIGYSTDRWSIDAAYLFIFRETRNIIDSVNAPFVDGKWNTNMQGFMVTLGVKL